jgi:hypothetical protein
MKNLITICLFFAIAISACKKDPATPAVILPAAPATISVYPDDTKDSLVFESVFNTSSTVTSYNVYASTTPGFKGTIVGTVGTGTSPLSFVHKGLTNGTVYYYYVAAVCAAGEGAKSIEVSTTPHLPLSKSVSMLFQQYLPAVCQAAPYRYYDPTNAEYGKNPYAKTDTFKLFISYKAVAGHDTSIFTQNLVPYQSMFRPQDVIVANFPEKWLGWVTNPGFNNTTSFVNVWLWSGDANTGMNKLIPGLWDTIPAIVKISNLTDLSKVTSIWIRCTDTDWFKNRGVGYLAMYDREMKISEFTIIEGFSKLDKSKPTIYHANGAYYFVTPIKNTRGSGFSFESTVKYSDGSQSSQMLVNGL